MGYTVLLVVDCFSFSNCGVEFGLVVVYLGCFNIDNSVGCLLCIVCMIIG